ncbi:hypothetical protein [Actinoplanes sp. NPDC051859]|uniref:hypothetical protein n=1 Tax=Actinoplanes sp. NPDC051859 TaxID=3363909 RepID=UPI00378EF1B4
MRRVGPHHTSAQHEGDDVHVTVLLATEPDRWIYDDRQEFIAESLVTDQEDRPKQQLADGVSFQLPAGLCTWGDPLAGDHVACLRGV